MHASAPIHPPIRLYPCAGCCSSLETTGNPSSRCHLPSAQPHGPTELGGRLQHHASTPRCRPLVKHSRLCSAGRRTRLRQCRRPSARCHTYIGNNYALCRHTSPISGYRRGGVCIYYLHSATLSSLPRMSSPSSVRLLPHHVAMSRFLWLHLTHQASGTWFGKFNNHHLTHLRCPPDPTLSQFPPLCATLTKMPSCLRTIPMHSQQSTLKRQTDG
ncbi:hypothetical protein IWX49DRAFT_575331 [Phyllosticta citricarpa]|uniref:Uncharacterized protein n=2 Tax=Phyllosticta TaxID=121621 RepID=A0ABR1M8E7_9PEZI